MVGRVRQQFNQWRTHHRLESGGRLTFSSNAADSPNVLEEGAGIFTIDLRSVDPDATPENGVLLVNGGKNEDNLAHAEARGDGTFRVYVRDNGRDASASISFEQDPFSFVYIPFSKVNDSELLAAGRVSGGSVINPGDPVVGPVAVTKGGAGTWYLSAPGWMMHRDPAGESRGVECGGHLCG